MFWFILLLAVIGFGLSAWAYLDDTTVDKWQDGQ